MLPWISSEYDEARKLEEYIAAHVGSLNMRLLGLAIHSNYESKAKDNQLVPQAHVAPYEGAETANEWSRTMTEIESPNSLGDSPGNSTKFDDTD